MNTKIEPVEQERVIAAIAAAMTALELDAIRRCNAGELTPDELDGADRQPNLGAGVWAIASRQMALARRRSIYERRRGRHQ